ncbi:hypothetical protein NMG60_11012025 [Bertholletia excelsa]
MGKLLPSAVRLRDFARLVASDRLQHRPKQIKPVTKTRIEAAKPRGKLERLKMEEISGAQCQKAAERRRVPLAEVVSDCVKRWFEDTLKEAEAGDSAMQVLVGQMYYSGYGVPRDAQNGRAWITRASNNQPTIWNVGDKRPGDNASDSDLDDIRIEAK